MLQSFAVGKVYKDHKGPINGLDFTHDGMNLVTSGDDSIVYVYSCAQAQRAKQLRCEKYGICHIRFLHNDKDCAVAASRNPKEHVLKYWDFHENKYLRIFRAHSGATRSISPHPYEDSFLSGNDDKTVLLWDLRQDRPVAKIDGEGPTVASFDQQGVVFAASVGQPRLHLFDSRNYAKGEFSSFDLTAHLKGNVVAHYVQFSPCGKYLLVRTAGQLILIDAYDGELICEYPLDGNAVGAVVATVAPGAEAPKPSFSPDSQYVMSGVTGGDICIWSTTNAKLVQRLPGHTFAPSFAQFSPTHALAVSAAETLAWWIPDANKRTSAGPR
eukprot:TRINITY_DN6108_c0_g1_i3.p1 TRINITY_DN6108_c0_g1~~TRINITY_DN6108_c0_g1_i3.p1  ORF type:complete len:367 (-),score=42.19 TRINITY_DN6108_c0_g1_i3:263-1243(-)